MTQIARDRIFPIFDRDRTTPERRINLSEREKERLIAVAEHAINTLENDKYILPDRWDEDIKKLSQVTDSTFIPSHSANHREDLEEEVRNRMDNAESREELYEILHAVTRAQDLVNLRLRSKYSRDSDEFFSHSVIDYMNALILHMSENDCNPNDYLISGYVQEKTRRLEGKLFELKHNYEKW